MTLEQLLETLDLDSVPEDHALDSTLQPTLAPRFRAGRSVIPPKTPGPTLPPPSDADRASHEMRIRGQLAEGGMGSIFLAEQPALRRDVALKTLKDEFMTPLFASRLRREARVLALVEHPNVVPVHALDTDERNAPVVVMKRIEGTPWRTLIHEPDHPALPTATDRLAWHLRVLMRICEAVHYAHSRGVLHLDLKPDNVMIGAFREVYLVDWGVAVSTDDAQRDWLPMADEVSEILGTPAYLAPEMVDLARAPLSARTDVYLLGGTLHEILLGRPPHEGESLHDLLYAAYGAQLPEVPPSVPEELGRILRKAMAPEAADRFESAEALRSALSDFLEHRVAASVADRAREALVDLRMLVDESAREPTHPKLRIAERQDSRNAQVQRAFARARFGFAEALRHHSAAEDAREGLASALLAMTGYHLARMETASAEGLLQELGDEPRAETLRQEAAQQRSEAARLEKLDAFGADAGSRARGGLIFAVALIVSIPGLLGYIGTRMGLYHYEWWHTLAYTAFLSVVIIGGAFLLRRSIMSTRRSRSIMWSIAILVLLSVALRAVAYSLGVREAASLALELFFFGSGSAVAAVLADRRFYLPSIAFFGGTALVLLAPDHMLLWVALSAFAGPGALAWAWIRADEGPPPEDESATGPP